MAKSLWTHLTSDLFSPFSITIGSTLLGKLFTVCGGCVHSATRVFVRRDPDSGIQFIREVLLTTYTVSQKYRNMERESLKLSNYFIPNEQA